MSNTSQQGDGTADRQRRMQQRQDDKGASGPDASAKSKVRGGVQAGANRRPDKLPAQHIDKLGLNSNWNFNHAFLPRVTRAAINCRTGSR